MTLAMTNLVLGLTLLLSLISATLAALCHRKNSKGFLRKELRELGDRIDELDATLERRWGHQKAERMIANTQKWRAAKKAEAEKPDELELDEAQKRGPLAMLKYNMRKNGLE